MIGRAALPVDHKSYSPLHRPRSFNTVKRKLLKYTGQATWYTNLVKKDPGGEGWKRWVVRKHYRRMMKEGRYGGSKRPRGKPLSNYKPCDEGSELTQIGKRPRGNPLSNYDPHLVESTHLNEQTRGNSWSNYKSNEEGGSGEHRWKVLNSTVMFVPKTMNSKLIDMLQETENNLSGLTGWGTKLVEKPGVPLLMLFIKPFPMKEGCARGKECLLCNNKGNKCMAKRVVYQATCKLCPEKEGQSSSYIGETSRQVGTRVNEHMNNLKNWKKRELYIKPLDDSPWS